MGQLVTTVAGGAAGFLIGGPLGASIGMTLGGAIGQSLFGPTVQGPRLNDLKVSASTLGAAIPQGYGTFRLGSNMIWTTGIRETSRTRRAGKGGPKQTTFSYDASFALAICEGPIDDVLRIWADGKLVYDITGGATRTPFDEAGDSFGEAVINAAAGTLGATRNQTDNFRIRIYRGTEDQLPDSLIEADRGVGNVSAHRGIAYVVFENLELENFGNRIPQFTFEVTRALASSFPSLSAANADSSPIPTIDNREWVPDWELGRLISIRRDPRNPRADVLNIDTMETLYSTDEQLFDGVRRRYIVGEGLFYDETGTRNSRAMNIWDIFTFSKVGQLGIGDRSLGGFYLNNCGEIPSNAGGAYGALGEMGYGYSQNGTRHILLIGRTRTTWAFAGNSTQPLFNVDAAFEPTFIFPARTDLQSSEMVSWRNANDQLELEIWRINQAAQSALVPIDTPVGCTGPSFEWRPTQAFTQTRINLKPFENESFGARVLLYDPSDETLFMLGEANGETVAAKWFIETEEYKFITRLPDVTLPEGRMNYSRLNGGRFGYMTAFATGGGRFVEIDLQNGNVNKNISYGGSFGPQGDIGEQQQWDDITSSLIVETRDAYRRIFFRTSASNLTIGDVVAEVCNQTTLLTPTDYDVSGLNADAITGYVIDRETTARDVLRQLATAFLFDGFESDYVLKFKSRGSESQVTIPEDWIGRDSDNIVVRETITQEIEMPMRITVNYYDITRDHQQGSQTTKRRVGPVATMLSNREDVIDLPIVWSPTQAKQISEKLLNMEWANRAAYAFDLPWRYLKYDPTDVVTVVLESGTVYEMRLTEMTTGADFVIQTNSVSERAAAYVSDSLGTPSDSPLQSIFAPYPANAIVLNTSLLRDLDYDATENALCYVTVGTNAVNYNGAAVFISDGFDFANIGPVDNRAVNGFTQSVLPRTVSYESLDEKTELFVRLSGVNATLESVTLEDMLNVGANPAMVGDEIIQFRDAELQENGTWRLTGLLRARRGTNYAVNSHVLGERFVFLDPETMVSFQRAPENYNATRDFRAVPTGTLIEDANNVRSTLAPRDLQPFTPEDVMVSQDGDIVTVSAQRRSRITAPLQDGSGQIHYREGDKPSARITFQIWYDLSLADVSNPQEPQLLLPEPDLFLSQPIFDSIGDDLPLEAQIDISQNPTVTNLLISITEIGAVAGVPKWIAIERASNDLWNIDELY